MYFELLQQLLPEFDWQEQQLTISQLSHAHHISLWHAFDPMHSCIIKQANIDCYEQLQAEAKGLMLMSASTFKVPKVYVLKSINQQAYLVMEFLELQALSRIPPEGFAKALASLHAIESDNYGLSFDNNIGATRQLNEISNNWCEFYIERRLKPQFKWLKQGITQSDVIKFEQPLYECAERLLTDHQPPKSLVHGDLWSGNAASCDDMPCIYDPAVYYGDPETDLAMMQLFSGFPSAVFKAYHQIYPKTAGFEDRQKLYQLYHLLNHINLFGNNYQSQTLGLITQLLE
jgi:fructosamine-3-kinase